MKELTRSQYMRLEDYYSNLFKSETETDIFPIWEIQEKMIKNMPALAYWSAFIRTGGQK
ncbi:MAG: hypothetical protein GY714_20835 [Desulfobacterales bacterium]|nr:hypothetical protein [Desulfobacterales bacterium]